MFTLDTNVLIYYAAGDERVATALDNALLTEQTIFIPSIVVVEFFAYPAMTRQETDTFYRVLQDAVIVPLDFKLGLSAAAIRRDHSLKLADSVVAATAISTRSTLATRNLDDFKKVTGLQVVRL